MLAPIDALFKMVKKEADISRYLSPEYELEEYRECKTYSQSLEEQLRRDLSGKQLDTLERYITNIEGCCMYQCKALFTCGLSLGIRLATLGE